MYIHVHIHYTCLCICYPVVSVHTWLHIWRPNSICVTISRCAYPYAAYALAIPALVYRRYRSRSTPRYARSYTHTYELQSSALCIFDIVDIWVGRSTYQCMHNIYAYMYICIYVHIRVYIHVYYACLTICIYVHMLYIHTH